MPPPVSTRAAVFCAAAALMAAPGAALAADPAAVWGRNNGTVTAMLDDQDACNQAAKAIHAEPDIPYVVAIGRPAGAMVAGTLIGNAIAAPIAQAMENAKARRAFIPHCMYQHGWHAVRLTAVEQAQIEDLKPEARSAWIADFYGREDFATRLAATTPPSLPQAKAEPWTYGALRFTPDKLTAPVGPVAAGGVVLSGTASHRRTARLAEAVELHISVKSQVAAGTVLHETLLPSEDGAERTYWCGPFRSQSFNLRFCVRNEEDNYLVFYGKGGAWLVTDVDTNNTGMAAPGAVVRLDESSEDLAGPVGFAVALRKIGRDTVTLEAVINQGKDYETLWTRDLTLNASGRAVLPLWSHRLVLQRSGSGLNVTLAADGDGTALPFSPPPE